jgi:uncharacterized protein
MSTPAGFVEFAGHKYLNLETYRKNGQAARTPIWFAADPAVPLDSSEAKLYAYSTADSGKVKRIRNNPHVRVAPCDIRGKLLGEWVDGLAQIVTGAEAGCADKLLNKKYWPWKQLLNFFASFRGRGRTCFVIRPA